MKEIFEFIEMIDDTRQQRKVKHSLKDIVVIVLFATLANANEWEEIEGFAKLHKDYLKQYIELKNGIPSHDTIQRVMAMIAPEYLAQLQSKWNDMLNSNEGEKLKKIINIDGKTMKDSGNKENKPHHIVSAYSKADGFCLGQLAVSEKSNEIKAIPKLLQTINIKGHIITIDAMGTQTKIAEEIKKGRGDYVLSVKGNQGNLYKDLIDYFNDEDLREQVLSCGNYKKTKEKAHGQIETREYYQTDDIKWLHGKELWKGLKSIGIVETSIEKEGKLSKEIRYYISSLKPDIELFEKSVRGHWAIESMHWHLDVTFREDFNKTIERNSALNLNIIRKLCLSILKLFEVRKQKTSLKLKRFYIGCKPVEFIEQVLLL